MIGVVGATPDRISRHLDRLWRHIVKFKTVESDCKSEAKSRSEVGPACGGSPRREGASLGIYTNFAASHGSCGFQHSHIETKSNGNLVFVDETTGEIKEFNDQAEREFDPLAYRANKYILLSAARECLKGSYTIDSQNIRFRVCNCCRAPVPPREGVQSIDVYKSLETKKASLRGLQRCSSIWVCPVCGSKITEERAKEVAQCIDGWTVDGGMVILVTFTFSHSANQPLRSLTDKMKKAAKGFHETRPVRAIKNELGFFEAIKSPEGTWGIQNGWHPHQHELWFIKPDRKFKSKRALKLYLTSIKKQLFPHWKNYCLRNGLQAPSLKHGIDIRQGQNASYYISKMGWSLAAEVTKTNVKKGKNGRLAPFDILQKYIDTNDIKYKKLYQEYACSTFGLQFISRYPKLRALYLNQPEQSDEQLIKAQEDQNDILLGSFTLNEWYKIIDHSAVYVILDLAESRDFNYVKDFVKTLPPPKKRKIRKFKKRF